MDYIEIYEWVIENLHTLTRGQNFSSMLKKRKPDFFQRLCQVLPLSKNGRVGEKSFYDLVFPDAKKTCVVCEGEVKFWCLSEGYRATCSIKCHNRSEETKKKKEETSLKNYGYKNPSQSPDVKKAKSETSLKNYGVSNPLKSEEVKRRMIATKNDRYGEGHAEVIKKCRETNLKKYGVENWMQADGSSDVFKNKYKEKTGYDNPMKNPAVREKTAKTNEMRYGGNNPMSSKSVREKVKSTSLDRYGVDNPTKNPEISRKALRNSFITMKIYIDGIDFEVQGKAEACLLKRLVSEYGTFDVITQFSEEFPMDLVRKLGWTPDFYVKSTGMFFECKSTWTLAKNMETLEKNRHKARMGIDKVRWVVNGRHCGFVDLPNLWFELPEDCLASIFNMEKLHGV